MTQLDLHRNNLNRKTQELIKLQEEISREKKKVSDKNVRINNCHQTIGRTKVQSTINSKIREIERLEKELLNIQKKISSLDVKVVKKQREISDLQKKIEKEEGQEFKKREQKSAQQLLKQQRSFQNIENRLNQHGELHKKTISAIDNLRKIPDNIVVLFLASNPIDQAQLRLDEEARSIMEMISKSKHRDSIRFQTCWAVQPKDILQAINEYNPSIVHFSGHGSDRDEVIFQTSSGNSKPVSKEAIVQTMMASSEEIRLVFFNTCYSKNQAEAVVSHVEAAIGMNTSIGDVAALTFSAQFYSSIGFGLTVQKAFAQAKALLMLEGIDEQDTPELFINPDLLEKEIIIVNPNRGKGVV